MGYLLASAVIVIAIHIFGKRATPGVPATAGCGHQVHAQIRLPVMPYAMSIKPRTTGIGY
jgi:hypothetical protein